VVHVRRPRIALAWDTPVSPSSAGWTRYVLERQFGYPVTIMRTRQLASTGLARFDVLILPSGGGYAQTFGPAGIARLKEWVQAGGTLIGLAEAVGFLADSKVQLLAIQPEDAARDAEPRKAPEKPEKEEGRAPGKLLASAADYAKAIQAEKEPPDSVPGVLLRARTDPEHWLTAGAAETVHALLTGRAVYTPIKLDKGVNAAVFEAPEKLLASGYLWEENRKQLAFKPLVVVQPHARGFVIGFTADPNYRAYMDGMNTLFLNAVFRGPAHAQPEVSAE
jgi:hypothetical protein